MIHATAPAGWRADAPKQGPTKERKYIAEAERYEGLARAIRERLA